MNIQVKFAHFNSNYYIKYDNLINANSLHDEIKALYGKRWISQHTLTI